ncbi:hypothetical protein HII31_08190 [Pseudocercospora fuligena]|uniref:Uncharacterized protein n=1 Tax=Pseudocercospora fuligena TaxID=685502 RepID=A0A8H6RI63_9PEZI|nr:hypothetical protein HII31_08190 [Pseudocercospora fuligena]
MSDDPAYFLVPASSGLCIQLKNGTIYTAEPNGSAEQKWFIEKGNEGQIAFRNGRDGQYLRGVGGGKGARIVTGQKQFWSLETSNTPNAFWIKCVDFPNAYLCNSYGKWSINNLIYMWAHEVTPLDADDAVVRIRLWYLGGAQKFEARLRSKQAWIFRAKELAEKEEQLRQKSKSADKQDSQGVDKQEPDEKQKKLEDRENRLAEKELQLQEREARLKDKEESLRSQAVSEASIPNGDLGPAIRANRVQSTRKELEAASVGRRSAPLKLRTSQRNAIEKGELRPITMPSNFVHLPRLRAG